MAGGIIGVTAITATGYDHEGGADELLRGMQQDRERFTVRMLLWSVRRLRLRPAN